MEWIACHFGTRNHVQIYLHQRDHSFRRGNLQNRIFDMCMTRIYAELYRLLSKHRFIRMVSLQNGRQNGTDLINNRLLFTGIPADLYELPENAYGDAKNNPNNSCFDSSDYDAIKGLQNISPCQYSMLKTIAYFANFYQHIFPFQALRCTFQIHTFMSPIPAYWLLYTVWCQIKAFMRPILKYNQYVN